MSILHKYLLRQNLSLLGICLLASVGIYLLVDVFERLDDFLAHDAGLITTVQYFLYKLPLIVSQILPLVFFIALALQLGIMQRNREITALEAGGISFQRLGMLFLVYAVLWSGVQLGCSQFLGVEGHRKSKAIEEGLGQQSDKEETVRDVWLRQGEFILHLDLLAPESQRVEGVQLIRLSEGFDGAEEVIRSERGRISAGEWILQEVRIQRPQEFEITRQSELTLSLGIAMDDLMSRERQLDIRNMTLWELASHIREFREAGANTEPMATLWHQTLAYAFSVVILAVIGLSAIRYSENTVMVICIGVLVGFVYYGVFVLGGQMGESGAVPAWLGGWLAPIVIGTTAVMWMIYSFLPQGLLKGSRN